MERQEMVSNRYLPMESHTSKEWPTPDEQRKYPKHLFKRRQNFRFPLRRYRKGNVKEFQLGEFYLSRGQGTIKE